MTQQEFHNRLRSLFNIDGDLLPELSADEQWNFVRDPVRYFLKCNNTQAAAIWREIERRQPIQSRSDQEDVFADRITPSQSVSNK